MPRAPRPSLVTVLVLLAALACTTPEERFADHVARGQQYAGEGRHDEALLEYKSAFKLQPDNALIAETLAALSQQTGAIRDAILFYREAYRLDPERVEAAMGEARLVLNRNRERAATLVEEALAKAPEKAVVHRTRARLALRDRDLALAREAASRALELRPDDAANHFLLGDVVEAEIRAARRAREPAGDALFEEAVAAYERAGGLRENGVRASLARSRVLGAWDGHRDEAREAFRETVALAKQDGNTESWLNAASQAEQFGRRIGDTEMRRWALREILSADPSRLEAWQRLARLAEATGESPDASEAIYRELLDRRPRDPAAHLLFVNFLADRGTRRAVIAHLSDVIASGVESEALYEALIQAQLRRGDREEARATLAGMSRSFPDAPQTRRARARLALSEGRPAEAVELLRALIRRNENYETQRLLAVSARHAGDSATALTAVDRAMALAGRFTPETSRLRARIHADARQWAKAHGDFQRLLANGVELTREEELIFARVKYGIGGRPRGRAMLLEQLARTDPPPRPAVAVEFYRREGKDEPARARAELEAAHARVPGNLEVLEALGELDVAEGRAAEAIARLDAVIDAQRVNPRVVLLRARLLAEAGALERAEADALRAFEAVPELPGAIELLLSIYQAQGRIDQARRSFEEADSAGVLHSGARLLLARLHRAEGDVAKARATYERILEDEPDLVSAKNDLAYLLADEGKDLDRALQLAQEARRALRDDPRALDTVGYVYLRQGLHEAALQQFRHALELLRDEPASASVVHYHMGLTLRALGRDAAADQSFRIALQLDSEFPGAEDARAQLERAEAAAAPQSS